MKPGAEILNELQELNSILSRIEKVNLFTVPQGYFETLSAIILLNSKKEVGQNVPEGYFDQLAGNILSKIKAQQQLSPADELRQLSPMLYSIQGSNVFEVPAAYFNNIADAVINQLHPEATVVKMSWRSSFVKYAAAAVVVSFITLSIFKFANKSSSPDKQNNIAAVVLDPSIQKGKMMNDQQFNEALNNLSADDIAGYLEKNGNESDIAELSINIDDNSLPKQDDYLVDKTALEKFLSDDNTKQTAN
jgi:hypothetical protein